MGTSSLTVVTGAAGLVGGNLVRALLGENRRVRALVRQDRAALQGLEVEFATAELTDPASLEAAFSGAEVVYHVAGSISLRMDNWEALETANVRGTRNVVAACLRQGVRRLVHFSSIHTLQQDPLDQPLDETRPFITNPQAPPYERSKAAAELVIQQAVESGLEAVIVIPTAILGPNDFKPSYIGRALHMLARGRIPVLVMGGYDWVDVRDVVFGAMQAERSGTSGERFILSGRWYSIREVAGMVSEISGLSLFRPVVPLRLAEMAEPLMAQLANLNGSEPLYSMAMLNALRSNRHISHAHAAERLDYHPRPFRDTLADTLAWFKQHTSEGK
ncbi:MAG: NAD-dependent epimerase/dehydratase family protein [Anaerolineales bacterium]|nr:NAD-dependent epimerase/dehydratase family protein [Anaerolineales bacterium]